MMLRVVCASLALLAAFGVTAATGSGRRLRRRAVTDLGIYEPARPLLESPQEHRQRRSGIDQP
jgi:hypothetical protein